MLLFIFWFRIFLYSAFFWNIYVIGKQKCLCPLYIYCKVWILKIKYILKYISKIKLSQGLNLKDTECLDVLLTVHLSIFIWVINQLDAQNFCFTISLFHASTRFEHTCKIALHSLWYHHTYMCDDTRGCVMQFWLPDDEHICSKHVEAWNKLIVKQNFVH